MEKFQLSIPEPCHENWDQMTSQDKGRFCNSCQKTVVDFSGMSDREIAAFFKKPKGNTCGRFHTDQLSRVLAPPQKRIPWIKYFFQFSLPAFLVTARASAQGKVKVKEDTVAVPRCTMVMGKVMPPLDKKLVKGNLVDKTGGPIMNASVIIKGTTQGVTTDSKGTFSILAPKDALLEFSSIGFETRSVAAKNLGESEILLELEPFAMGEVVVVSRKKRKAPIPVISKVMDTAFKHFKVYPNPAVAHSKMKIDCSKLEKGSYVLSVISMNGEVLQNRDVTLNGKKEELSFSLEDIVAGSYVIHFFNRKTAASFTEKIIVQ